MQEQNGLQQQKTSRAVQARAAVPAEIKLLADVVIQFNILKKNLAIYPQGHHLITQSTATSLEVLEKSFQRSPVVTIGAAKDCLFLGGRRIQTKNPVFRDFAAALSRLGITSLVLIKGLQAEELLRLQGLLSLRPEEILARGDMAAVAAEAGLEHVRIKLLDYSIFRPTEEAEIKGPVAAPQPADLMPGGDLWSRFTRGLRPRSAQDSGGTAAESVYRDGGGELAAQGVLEPDSPVVMRGGGDGLLQHGTELDEHADDSELSPAMIVRKLNDGTLPVDLAITNYADVLAQCAGSGFRRSLLGKESLRFFDRMSIILHNLKPDIRERFLKTALKFVSVMTDYESMEELLKCFPADLAAEMMGVADLEGRQLSPALQKLMVKLSAVQDGITESELRQEKTLASDKLPFMETLEILPKREQYEKHMTEDYARQLSDLNDAPAAVSPPEEFCLDEHLESLGRQNLDMHIGRVLIALMDQDIESSVYHDFAQKVIELVPALLDAGSFRPMNIIFTKLQQHAAQKQQADVRALAKMAIQIFFEPAFVRQMVAQLAETGDDASSDLLALLKQTGQQVIPELIDVYAGDQSPGGNRRLFELLCSFGKLSVEAALTRLYHRGYYYVRNLLRLIKAAGDESVIASVRPLLRHADHDLRHEALEVLLQFKDTGAVATLRQQLRSGDMAQISRAVLLIHKYRLPGFGSQLLSLIKLFMPFQRDVALNCMVLQALGELGDAAVLPSLQKIARARLTLAPGNLKKTKIALFESLAYYPRGAIKEIAGIGLRSGNEQIRQICSSLGA